MLVSVLVLGSGLSMVPLVIGATAASAEPVAAPLTPGCGGSATLAASWSGPSQDLSDADRATLSKQRTMMWVPAGATVRLNVHGTGAAKPWSIPSWMFQDQVQVDAWEDGGSQLAQSGFSLSASSEHSVEQVERPGLDAATGTQLTPMGWAGEYRDAETGLIYLRARYYEPATAQFLTRDPLEALTRSAHGYVGNNPLNMIDPSGLFGIPVGLPSLGDLLSGITASIGCLWDQAWNGVTDAFAAVPWSSVADWSITFATIILAGLCVAATGGLCATATGTFLITGLVTGTGAVGNYLVSSRPKSWAGAAGEFAIGFVLGGPASYLPASLGLRARTGAHSAGVSMSGWWAWLRHTGKNARHMVR